MRLQTRLAVLAGALALVAIPAYAVADVPSDPGPSLKPTTPAGPPSGLPSQAKAYGFYCQDETKKKGSGGQGKSAFAICVTGMAKLASGSVDTPKQACRGLSKKHVNGQKRSAYAICVSGGRDLLQNQDQSQESAS